MDAARGAGAILLSDYGKGVVTPAVIAAALAAAKREGAVLIVDSKARSFEHYGAADVIKPNAAELAHATDLPTETDAEIEIALARALELSACKAVLVTRSAKGMSVGVRGEPVRHFRRAPPEVYDTSGAGDTALAALGSALAAGREMDEAIEFALLAASVVVEKAGTATASPEELVEAELKELLAPVEAKIATAERMGPRGGALARAGPEGRLHQRLFRYHPPRPHRLPDPGPRAWCEPADRGGEQSDASVRALKGEGRPVNDLAGIPRPGAGGPGARVDLVASFDEETPLALDRDRAARRADQGRGL